MWWWWLLFPHTLERERAGERTKEICHTSELSIYSRLVDRQFSLHKCACVSSVNASTPSNIIVVIEMLMMKKKSEKYIQRKTQNRKLNAQLISDKWLLNTINALNMPSALLLLWLLRTAPARLSGCFIPSKRANYLCVICIHIISFHPIASHRISRTHLEQKEETSLRASYSRIYL